MARNAEVFNETGEVINFCQLSTTRVL